VLNDVLFERNALGYGCFGDKFLRKIQVYGHDRDSTPGGAVQYLHKEHLHN
jgi:hypothetical protein